MERLDGTKFHFVETGQKGDQNNYNVELEIPMSVGWIDNCLLILEDGSNTKNIHMKFAGIRDNNVVFRTDVSLETRACYRYFFRYTVDNVDYYVNRYNTKKWINYDEKNKLSVNFSVPEWAKGAIMYHIFVDRFYRGSKEALKTIKRRYIHPSWEDDVILGDNGYVTKHHEGEELWNVDFYGGDLQGIIQKLDYLESLGVSILYLSPIVFSTSNHRYDASDYEMVDPYAGCNEDLRELCCEAHKRGMKVLLDGVFNHVGAESKYFDRYGEFKTSSRCDDGCYHNVQSKYSDMFRHKQNGEFSYWWDFPNLPELDCDSEAWKKYICGEGGVIDKWFELGIDGLRLDVADNLSDAALEEIHKAVIRNKSDGFILGEVWDNPMRNGRSYISSGRSMHSVMNYPLTDALVRYFKEGNTERLGCILKDTQAEYPIDTVNSLMNFTSTHDYSRAITLFGKKKFASDEFKKIDDNIKCVIMDTLFELGFSDSDVLGLFSGTKAMNYYDYQGLMKRLKSKNVDVSVLRNVLSFDPFDSRQIWAKDLPEDIKRDLEYTKKYTLTADEYLSAKELYKTYLFFLASYPGIFSIFYGDEAGMQGLNNLANRRTFPWEKEDRELVSYFQRLGEFRKKYPFLKEADFHLLDLSPASISYERVGENDRMFITINNSDRERQIIIPEEYSSGKKVLSLKKNNSAYLYPHDGVIIKK